MNRESFLAELKIFFDGKRGNGLLGQVGMYICNQDGI